ncbi:hypothetical protein HFN62_23655 [Rhizobium leguminosarum]|uniref:hypothetical protein n=1 Tax=Rhizobium leguminosarum TaxID=384 RepID=UPI001C985A56|nr:hypothetical protein [Rhizobium leguminosarum]MBY5786709.1 hypothetical protein [Rhizobium leguminosarum]
MEFDLTEVEKARIISSQNSGFHIVVTKPGSQRPEIIGGEWINEGGRSEADNRFLSIRKSYSFSEAWFAQIDGDRITLIDRIFPLT